MRGYKKHLTSPRSSARGARGTGGPAHPAERRQGGRHAFSGARPEPSGIDPETDPPAIREPNGKRRIRYAVVGLGHIAQAAVLPAFAHARKTSMLAALVSSNAEKLKRLGKHYGVDALYTYDQFEECIRNERIDAVYIALPNDMHRDYTIRAAEQGAHVLCEKPMALTEEDGRAMLRACEERGVKLMVAYRLHFEEANLRAIEIATSGRIGEPRLFSSTFSLQVRPGDIRTSPERGGGALYDIGIYCINAARALFRDEPVEVVAMECSHDRERFPDVEETIAGALRFSRARLASFVCSFGAADVSEYRLTGTRGDLRVEPAYDYHAALRHYLTTDGRTSTWTYPKRDQFAPEIEYFARCILSGRDPEPNGREGLADVRVMEALHRSARVGSPVAIEPMAGTRHPSPEQNIHKPPVRHVELVEVQPPALS